MKKNWLASVLVFSLCAAFLPSAVEAATFNVNSVLDSVDSTPGNGTCADSAGRCTLRAAIIEANALAGADTVNIPAGLYMLSRIGMSEDLAIQGDLDLSESVTIIGAGSDATIISGLNTERVFQALTAGTFSFSNLRLTAGNQTVGNGGGISVDNAAAILTLSGVSVTGCNAANGGAVFALGKLTISNSDFSNNRANTGSGGAVLNVTNNSISVTGSSFRNNFAASGGGAIYSANTELELLDSDFFANDGSTSVGGDLFASLSSGAATVSGVTSRESKSTTGGSLVITGPSLITLENSTFEDNRAADTVGAVYLLSAASTVNLANVSVSRGFASSGAAGGIFVSGAASINASNLQVLDCSVRNGDGGGAVLTATGNLVLSDVVVSRNSVAGTGGRTAGGLYLTAGTASVSNLELTDNAVISSDSSVIAGGGYLIVTQPGGINMTDVLVAGNLAAAATSVTAAGLLVSSSGPLVLERAAVYNNTANGTSETGGGALLASAASNTVRNVSFSGNVADIGGALYLSGASTGQNLSFDNNEGSTAAHVVVSSTFNLSNSVLGAATGPACGGAAITSAGYNIDETGGCGLAGTGDRSGIDPLLAAPADNGGGFLTMAPLPGSPVIDAIDAAAACPAVDQRGLGRPFDGDANGSALCDIGALESQDQCLSDPTKLAPGICGCGNPDTDANSNSIVDCLSNTDIDSQSVVLTSKVRRLKESSKANTQRSLKNEIKRLSTTLQEFSDTWGSTVSVTGSKTLAQLITQARRSISKALNTDADDFANKKSAALKALKRLKNAV